MSAPAPLPTSSEAVRNAAGWLAAQNPRPTPVVPALRSRFGLSPLEAISAIREAEQQRPGNSIPEAAP